jgi:glycylpeptide N-tetradecanoyltransferase
VFSEEEVRHIFVPIVGVVRCWVLQNQAGIITDLCSFYHLHSTVIGHPRHNTLCAVYSYYNVAATMTLKELVDDLLVLAYNNGADVFNALDVMDNAKIFEECKFGQGDGFLHYYVYNWKTAQIEPEMVGMVLV